MPRKRKDADDHFSPEVKRAVEAARRGDEPRLDLTPAQTAVVYSAAVVTEALGRLLAHPDGYLKIDPTESGTCYFKWRFNKWKWKDHYVMVVTWHTVDLVDGLRLLADKAEEVRCGERTPTREDLGYFT